MARCSTGATIGVLVLASACIAAGAAGPAPAITGVRALPDRLVVRLSRTIGPIRIVELRPYETYSPRAAGVTAWQGAPRSSVVTVSRFHQGRDRLFSKLQLVDARTNRAIGPARWADNLDGLPAASFAMPWPRSKKGVSCPVMLDDLGPLGAAYADQGVVLAGVFDWTGSAPQETWTVDGQQIPINVDYIRYLDRQVKRMTEMGINTTLIVINGVPDRPDLSSPLIHPKTDVVRTPYHLGAFNLTDERGLRYFRAAFEYLAHRYSDPAAKHGWVSGYVVGNELQSHWAWHNMGRATPEEVTREYADHLRVAWLAVRRFHRDVRVYASLDHTWATHLDPDPMKSMRGDQFLDRLNQAICAGGNFPWHVAFHPYPEDLFQPRFWNDQTAELGFDSPRVTFKNLEVLPAFLAQKRFLYRGRPRRIVLTEQGFHCSDGPDGETAQAAAFAYAHWKVSHMPTIDAHILHRHVDHRDQGGLRLGLWSRKLDSTDAEAPDRKRLMWDVFRQADTDAWQRASEFALPVAGIKSWREALPFAGPIPKVSGRFPAPIDPAAVVYSLLDHMGDAKVTNGLAWRAEWAKGPDGLLYQTVLEHPNGPDKGVGEAVYTVALPAAKPDRRLALRFGTVVNGPTDDGVRMSIAVDGREVWVGTRGERNRPAMDAVDLSPYAGKTIQLALRVDSRKNNAGDWSNWLRPVIVWRKAR